MACTLPSCGTGMPRRATVLPTGEQCLRIRAEADQRGGSLRAYGDASEVRRKLGECCCGVEASRSCLSWQFGRHQPLRVAIHGGQTMDLMMFLVDFSLWILWACSYMARHAGFLPCTCVSCCWVRLRQVFRYFDAGDGGNESPGILRLQEPEHSLCFRALGTAA